MLAGADRRMARHRFAQAAAADARFSCKEQSPAPGTFDHPNIGFGPMLPERDIAREHNGTKRHIRA
ncbi:hypothetical protein D3C74_308470 [compost metagenome]